MIYPSSHHVTPEEVRAHAIETIKAELQERMAYFENEKKYVEHQRIHQRTMYDLEMIKEVGFCKGIENYSRHFPSGFRGTTTLSNRFFPNDYLLII